MKVRCPSCGAVGDAETEDTFLRRGRDGTKAVLMCRNCESGMWVSPRGKAKLIDASTWGRMSGHYELDYRRVFGKVPEGSMGSTFYLHPCPWCRKVIDPEEVQKCPGCGRQVAGLKCLNCGAPAAIRDYSCETCGTSLEWKSRIE